MILWKEAVNLSANKFGELMLAYIGASMSSQNKKANYKLLAKLIYRSHSRLQTWLSPRSKEPLPINERHHIYLVVLSIKSERRWQVEEVEYLNATDDCYDDIAMNTSRSVNSVTLKKKEQRNFKCIKPTILRNPLIFSDEEKKVLLSNELSRKQKAKYFKVKSESTILNWMRKLENERNC